MKPCIYIQVWDPHQVRQSKDRRQALMEIYHNYPPNCSVDRTHIAICVHPENHRKGQPAHINVEGISKKYK